MSTREILYNIVDFCQIEVVLHNFMPTDYGQITHMSGVYIDKAGTCFIFLTTHSLLTLAKLVMDS